MSKIFYATEYVDNKPVAVHRFSAVEQGRALSDYRALISLGAFVKRQQDQCLKDEKVRRFHVEGEQDLSHRSLTRLNFSDINFKCFEHKDLWAFYKSIGYDYQAKQLKEKSDDQQTV